MGLNTTPSSERVHIAFFGKRNAGKSSLVNAVTGQSLSVVSPVMGTTTDPVYKAMELLPLGPVMIIDTPGFDDEGELGSLRVAKTKEVLRKTDVAVLVVDGNAGFTNDDLVLEELIKEQGIPFKTVFTKADVLTNGGNVPEGALKVSAETGEGINELKEALAAVRYEAPSPYPIVSDLVAPGNTAVLVIPIDKAAPKGRLILPQQQTIRELLDTGCVPVCVRDAEFRDVFGKLAGSPSIVITDSQVFRRVADLTPENVRLTSFSILMARHKGFLDSAVRGVLKLRELRDGDRVLISEGCTHHRQCGDIGSVKLPKMIKEFTGKDVDVSLSSGISFPDDLSDYALVIHCGGCMLNSREMIFRMNSAAAQNVPFTNYGTAIAYMSGILKRALSPFPDLSGEIG